MSSAFPTINLRGKQPITISIVINITPQEPKQKDDEKVKEPNKFNPWSNEEKNAFLDGINITGEKIEPKQNDDRKVKKPENLFNPWSPIKKIFH